MTLSPSPTSFIPDTTRREALRKETSNVPIRTSLSQSMGEYISMTKTHPVNALYFDGKTISKSSTIIPSSSIYHESKIQDSAKQHRVGKNLSLYCVCNPCVEQSLQYGYIKDLFTLGNRILYVDHLVERPHLRKVKSATIFI